MVRISSQDMSEKSLPAVRILTSRDISGGGYINSSSESLFSFFIHSPQNLHFLALN